MTSIIAELSENELKLGELRARKAKWLWAAEDRYRFWSQKYYYVLHNIFLHNGKTLRYINMDQNPFAEDIAYLCPNLQFFHFGNYHEEIFLIDPFQLHVCHLLGKRGCVTPIHDLIIPGKFVRKISLKLGGLTEDEYFDSSIYGYLVQHPEEYGRYRHSAEYTFFPQVAEEEDPDTGRYESIVSPTDWAAEGDEKFETIILDDYSEGEADIDVLHHEYTPLCGEMYIPGAYYQEDEYPAETHPFWDLEIEDGFLDLFDTGGKLIKRIPLEGVQVVV